MKCVTHGRNVLCAFMPISECRFVKTCDVCGREVEAHREGWSYDHASDDSLTSICEGSGT